ncbi:NAD dependent epimerase/dehydratase family protein [Primorskyibacter flagellatus]|uniref:NAD dependent epimerase/dehydratase family protein n=2 Tax=Primorskyibacter flagellatus TaxID=1387277 RepID=A0A1W2A869_9RHOB|nr:NAD dependent epimerase/dehydratase family protein [Primorskyibacter flagellatus]
MTQIKRALLLGAGGKLGTMFRAAWENAPPPGFELVSIFRDPVTPEGGVRWQPGDGPLQVGPVHAVIALWGVTPGQRADLSDNGILAIEAQTLAHQLNAERVLHCSSAAIYKPSLHPLSEDIPGDPQNDYGRAKLEMEHAVADWYAAHPYGPKPCLMRIGNVAGADSLFATMRASPHVTLDRFADGQGPRRSYIAPQDFLHALVGLLRCPLDDAPFLVNMSAPKATSMQAIAEAAGCDIAWKEASENANALVELDTTRLQKIAPLPMSSADPDRLLETWRSRAETQ